MEYRDREARDRERDRLGPAKKDTHPYTLAHRVGEFWLMAYGYWYEEAAR